MMYKPMNTIATIASGLFVKPSAFGEIMYLQAKHFDLNGNLTSGLHPELKKTLQTERHLLQDKDVLFAAKGTKNFATIYENKNGHCVASSTFFVIRVKEEYQERILPAFLTWFINHPRTLLSLKREATGTSLPLISQEMLRQLEIPLPSIAKQEQILALDSLHKQETELTEKIAALKTQQIQHVLINSIK